MWLAGPMEVRRTVAVQAARFIHIDLRAMIQAFHGEAERIEVAEAGGLALRRQFDEWRHGCATALLHSALSLEHTQ